MNYDKDQRLARKLAKEQKFLKKKAKSGQELAGGEKSRASWDVEFDNYVEHVIEAPKAHKDRDPYDDYA